MLERKRENELSLTGSNIQREHCRNTPLIKIINKTILRRHIPVNEKGLLRKGIS
jgi:hypothetical protein